MLDISSLEKELIAAGAFEKCEARTWGKVAFLLACFAACAAGVVMLPFAWSLLLVPLSTMFLVPAAMMGHEGAHGAFSESRGRNELLFHILFPILSGKGALYWKHKHNDNHHETPNVLDADPDLNLWPLASHAGQHRQASAPMRWVHRNIQAGVLWPITLGLVWNMRFDSLVFLGRKAVKGEVTGMWWVDLGCQLLHYALWVAVPVALWGPAAIAFYVAVWSLTGPIIAGIFGPAHMGMPMKAECVDPVLIQLETTRNIELPGILPYLYIGLGNQIEHHLFPKIPHQRMDIAVPIVKGWAERIGIPYQTIGWAEGYADMTRFVRDAWKAEILPAEPGLQAPVELRAA